MFSTLTAQNVATLIADGSAIILLFGILMETGIMQRRGRVDDKLFFRIVHLIIIMAVFDMISYLIDKRNFAMARGISITVNTGFYVALILIVMAWFHYVLVRFERIDAKIERSSHSVVLRERSVRRTPFLKPMIKDLFYLSG